MTTFKSFFRKAINWLFVLPAKHFWKERNIIVALFSACICGGIAAIGFYLGEIFGNGIGGIFTVLTVYLFIDLIFEKIKLMNKEKEDVK